LDPDKVISLRNLTRRFGVHAAVDGLNLEIARGEIFGLVGPDGAGKTTTLRMLCGLMDPTSGEALVAGFDTVRQTVEVKDRIGYMAQRFGLYGDLTVGENMEFYADLFGITAAERQSMLPELLRMTRMEPFIDRPAAKLSGGMKQKLALMCTLLHHPQILFLDEPTNGVDPVSRRDFWVILNQLVKDGMTLFVSTAYMDEAERCDRVGLMSNGKLIQCDTPTALKRLINFECYEFECEEPRAARRALATAPDVTGVRPAGSSLHVFLKRGTAVESVAQFAGKNTHRQIEPSLEDVFIATVEKANGRG
jgi:ABC-2 type transport system ATP-binding protein